MNNQPFFSILIATYNRSEYLERCLASIFANDFDNLEVVISDDHSEKREDIEKILNVYLNRANVRAIWQPANLGIYRNYNFLLGQAKGKFVLFVDDDDKLKPNTLKKIKEYIERQPDYDLYGFGYEVIDEKDRVMRTHIAPKSLAITSKDEKLMKLLMFFDILPFWAFHSFAVCYKTSIREEITYRSDLSIAADSFFLFQCLSRGKKVFVIPENLYSYRMHPTRWTGPAITNIISRKAVLDHFRGFFETRDVSHYISAFFLSKEYVRRYLFDPIIFNRLAKEEVLRGELNLTEDDMREFTTFFRPRIYLWHHARIRMEQVADYLRLFGLKGLFLLVKTFWQKLTWNIQTSTKMRKRFISSDSYQAAVGIIQENFETVLDLGCWDERLRNYLPQGVKYQGLDFEKSRYFTQREGIINHDLEKGLPLFQDNSFDIVFMLRVLQSLQNAHFVFQEAQRVAKEGVVVSVTNMQYWVYRLKYLLGKHPVDSLKFFADPHDPKFLNRHKWLINYHQAVEFVKENARGNKVIITNCIYNHRFLKPLNLIEKILSRIWPNVFVYIVTFYVQKQ